MTDFEAQLVYIMAICAMSVSEAQAFCCLSADQHELQERIV